MLINLELARQLLKKVVDSVGPEFKYPHLREGGEPGELYDATRHSDEEQAACTYVRDNAPSCLVGQVLHALPIGVPLTVLSRIDAQGDNAGLLAADGVVVSSSGFHRELREAGFELTEAATVYLRAAQAAQDGGATWAKAYERAEGMLPATRTETLTLWDTRIQR